MTSPFIQWYNVLVLGDLVQSIQITLYLPSLPTVIANVVKRNLSILNYVPPCVKLWWKKFMGRATLDHQIALTVRLKGHQGLFDR